MCWHNKGGVAKRMAPGERVLSHRNMGTLVGSEQQVSKKVSAVKEVFVLGARADQMQPVVSFSRLVTAATRRYSVLSVFT